MVCCAATVKTPIQTSTKDIYHVQGRVKVLSVCGSIQILRTYSKKKIKNPATSTSENTPQKSWGSNTGENTNETALFNALCTTFCISNGLSVYHPQLFQKGPQILTNCPWKLFIAATQRKCKLQAFKIILLTAKTFPAFYFILTLMRRRVCCIFRVKTLLIGYIACLTLKVLQSPTSPTNPPNWVICCFRLSLLSLLISQCCPTCDCYTLDNDDYFLPLL